MRTASGDKTELERAIGPAPIRVTSGEGGNRGDVRKWLACQGVPSERIVRMGVATLAKCYNFPRYLERVIANTTTDDDDDSDDDAAGNIDSQPVEPVSVRPAETNRLKTARTEPDSGNDAEKLAEILARLAGKQGVDIETVRSIVRDEIACLPAMKLDVTSNGATHTLEGMRHYLVPALITIVATGTHAYLVGPAGSGKSTACEQVAEGLGRDYYFTGAVDSAYALSGFIDAQGRYVTTAYRQAYENGGVFCFDEIDASDPAALLYVNAGLANGHQNFPDAIIKRHPDFVCIAAANTIGQGGSRQYVGRNPLDAASLDRFAVIDWDYDEALETAIVTGVQKQGKHGPKIGGQGSAVDWLAYVQNIRAAVALQGHRLVVSPRASITGAKLLAAGLPWDFVASACVWKGADSAVVAKIKEAIR